MFVNKLNQITNVLPRHWESDARKNGTSDAKAIACALRAEQLSHSTGQSVVVHRVTCMKTFGLSRYSQVERAAYILDHGQPDEIAKVFSGQAQLKTVLSNKYTIKIQQPELFEGDSGMEEAALKKRGRAPVVCSTKLFTKEDGFVSDGALKLANDLIKIEENSNMPQDTALRLYKYIDRLVKDERYRRGGLITVEEMAASPEIYPDRVFSGKAGQQKMLTRIKKVKKELPTVCNVFNKFEGRESSAFALVIEYGVTPRDKGQTIGVSVPATHEAYDVSLRKAQHMQNVWVDRISTQEAARQRQIANGQLPQLGE